MATIKPVLWKGKRNAHGEDPIYIRLEAGNRRQYLSLKLRVKPTHWNPRLGEVRKSHRDYTSLNRVIQRKVDEAKTGMYALMAKGEEVTPAAIKEALRPTPSARHDFIACGLEYAEELRRLGKIPTSRRYFSIFRKLRTFSGGQLPFSGLSVPFFRRYRAHLVEHYGNAPSTVASNFRALKAIANRAIKDGLLSRDDNPFGGFSAREPLSAKRKLTLNEIDALRSLDLENGSLQWHVRNYFLFSFYCAGIRFRDLCLLKPENVRGGRLEYSMRKTGTPKSLAMVPSAMAILAQYKKRADGRVFPVLAGYDISTAVKLDRAVGSRNAMVNKILQELAELAGIETKVTFHMSRHSFADLARREGWDVYKISKALGHKDLSVTEAYLKGFDTESIDEEMGKLFGDQR